MANDDPYYKCDVKRLIERFPMEKVCKNSCFVYHDPLNPHGEPIKSEHVKSKPFDTFQDMRAIIPDYVEFSP